MFESVYDYECIMTDFEFNRVGTTAARQCSAVASFFFFRGEIRGKR